MATFYGGWVATDDFRAILEATVSNASATQCTVKLVLKVQSNYAYAGSSGRASVTCNGTTRSDNVSYDAGETTTLMTETFTVARGSAKKSVSVSGKVWQVNASSAYSKGSTASGKVTIPAIDYDAPNAPSSCAASRVSDTSAKVTWTNGSTTTLKPRSSTKVERQTDGGSWVQVASVGASTTSYTDNSISANHRYRYRVRAYGSGGYSSYATSGYIYTTPAAPASVTASVTQGTTVRIAVDGTNAPWATSWEVQSQLNGGEWTAVGTYTSFPATADIGGGTVRLRARSLCGPLASAWTESAEITTITPPLAPTVSLDPSGVQPTGTAVTVEWTPAHPDGSAQTQAQVAYKVGSAAEQTATVSGAATSYQLPAEATAAPATVSVRVRTHGADEDWGAWSEPVALTVAEPPSVAITSPGVDGAVVADLPLEAAWTVSDPTGVAAQTLTLYDASGRALHTAQLDGSARSYELGPSTYMLSNSSDYTLCVYAIGGSSLQTVEERDFRTSFAEPSAPAVDAEADHSDMSVSLTVHAGPSSTEAGEVVSLTVQRVNSDGSLWVVGDGLADGETVVDPLPPLNVPTDYVVTAHTAAGATSELRVTVMVDSSGRAAMNAGAAAGECMLTQFDFKFKGGYSHSGSLLHFASGTLPVFYATSDIDNSESYDFTLLGASAISEARAFFMAHPVCWVRTPDGRRLRCRVSATFDADNRFEKCTVSVSADEVEWGEAW